MTSPGDIREDAQRVREIAAKLDQTVGACFGKLVEVCRSRTAIIGASWRPTYGELDAASNSLARVLRERGGATGDRVAILMQHDAPQIAAVLAGLKAGCTVVVLNPTDPPARLVQVLDDAEPSILLTDLPNREQADWIGGARRTVICFEDHPASVGATAPEIHVEPGSVAMLVYTSGSTGKPKGVMRAHGDLIHQVLRFTRGLGLEPGDRIALLASLSGGQGMITTWCALLNGAALCPFPVVEVGVNGLAGWMVRNRITDFVSSASLFRHFMRTLPEGFKFPDVRLVRLGSEPATAADFAMYREHFGDHCLFFHTLSSSETGNICQLRLTHDAQVGEGRLPVGRPAEGVEVLLLAESGVEVADGEVGEIAVRSRHLSAGYWRNETLTRSRFLQPGPSGGPMVFRSGDLAKRTTDGQIMIVGRGDHRVKIRGHRIELSEVEDALQAQSSVDRAVVAVKARREGEPQLVAYVIPRSGHIASASSLRHSLRTVLPERMIPTRFAFLDELPLTLHGKIDRARLGEIELPVEPSLATGPPSSETEELVAGVWSEVFENRSIGRQDDFFALGGDSLTAMVVAARLDAVLQVQLDLRAFADHPTLAGLAAEVDRLRSSGGAPSLPRLTRGLREGPLPLSYHQERIWTFSRTPEQSAGYIVAGRFRLRGPLNIGVFGEVLNYMARRHEILRTTFAETDGRPFQTVHAAEPVDFRLIDLSGRPDAAEEARRLQRAEAARGFDLGRLPLIRFNLIRLGEQEHLLQRVNHHIISDGWSWQVYFREFRVIYESLLRGEVPPLPDFEPLQYCDYAAWQREHLRRNGEAWVDMIAWWKRALSGASGPRDLPFLRPQAMPDASPGDGVVVEEIDPAIAPCLDRLGGEQSTSYFSVRLAAFVALLSADCRQPDICLGAYVTDRTRLETQNMFGFFTNLATLRFHCDGDARFRDWVSTVNQVVTEAQARCGVPYEELCQELRRAKIIPPNILMIVKPTQRKDAMRLGEVEVSSPNQVERLSALSSMPWGFTLNLTNDRAGQRCAVTFDARIYDPAGVRSLMRRLTCFLESAAAGPDFSLAELLSRCPPTGETSTRAVATRSDA